MVCVTVSNIVRQVAVLPSYNSKAIVSLQIIHQVALLPSYNSKATVSLQIVRQVALLLPSLVICTVVGREQKVCHKLHSAISPSILQQFSQSQWLWKAFEKTFQSMPVMSQGNQYWLRYQADQLVTTMVLFIKLPISQKLPRSMLWF